MNIKYAHAPYFITQVISSDEESNEEEKEEETVSSLQSQRRSSKTPVNTGSRRSSLTSDSNTQPGMYLIVACYYYNLKLVCHSYLGCSVGIGRRF